MVYNPCIDTSQCYNGVTGSCPETLIVLKFELYESSGGPEPASFEDFNQQNLVQTLTSRSTVTYTVRSIM